MVFSQRFSCIDCGFSFPEITPRMFSFNNPQGACPACSGLGTKRFFDPDLIVDPSLSVNEGAILPWRERDPSFLDPLLAGIGPVLPFRSRSSLCKAPPNPFNASFSTDRMERKSRFE